MWAECCDSPRAMILGGFLFPRVAARPGANGGHPFGMVARRSGAGTVRYQASPLVTRDKTGPLDGRIGMSFALQWRYNFGALFKKPS